MSLFDTFRQREEQEREKQSHFTGYLKQKVNEYIEQGMSVDDAMKAAYSNENVLKEAEKAGKEIAMFKETSSSPNFDYEEIERRHLETDDKPTATRIFNAEIHWKQPIDIYITRPDGDDYFYEEGEHNDISTIDITTTEYLSTSRFHLLLEAALIPTVFGLKIIQEEEDGWHKVFFFETLDGINYIQVNPNQFYKMINDVTDGN